MKFKVIVVVTSRKTGVALDDEYDRIGFRELYRPRYFPEKQVTVEVDKEFARAHDDIFRGTDTGYIYLDSTQTEPEDWEDWGSVGHMLSQSKWTKEKLYQYI